MLPSQQQEPTSPPAARASYLSGAPSRRTSSPFGTPQLSARTPELYRAGLSSEAAGRVVQRSSSFTRPSIPTGATRSASFTRGASFTRSASATHHRYAPPQNSALTHPQSSPAAWAQPPKVSYRDFLLPKPCAFPPKTPAKTPAKTAALPARRQSGAAHGGLPVASGRTPLGTMSLGTMSLGTARRPGNASADQVEAMLDRMSELRQEAADAQTTSAELQEANALLMERLEEFQSVHESNVTTGEFGTHTTLAHTTLAHTSSGSTDGFPPTSTAASDLYYVV